MSDEHEARHDPERTDVDADGEPESTPDAPGDDTGAASHESSSEASSTEPSEGAYQYDTGDVVTGEVVNIKPYGAFVQLPDGETGLVHISEVDESYVKDVGEYLSIGQEIAVKVVGIHDSGKYNLSIRQLSNRERDSAFYSRQMHEFSRELEMRRDELQREATWRQAAHEQDDEWRLSHEAERADLEAWIERARDLTDQTRQKSEERSRAYPLL